MINLATDLGAAVHHLLKDPSILPGFRDQFRPHQRDDASVARNLNAAFLISVTGKRLAHPARGYLDSMTGDVQWGRAASFYLEALDRMERELEGPGLEKPAEAARDLVRYLDSLPEMSGDETVERFWNLFFPEGVGIVKRSEDAVEKLRTSRSVSILRFNPEPLRKPCRQVLFTSNVLMTVPLAGEINALKLAPHILKAVRSAAEEDQVHWYDHPIPIGIGADANEAVYGLRALDEAVRFEIQRGKAPADVRLPVLLSISTTHHGIQSVARQYLAGELKKAGGIDHLGIYAVAERDVLHLLEKVLLPASEQYFPGRKTEPFIKVLGVEGEYGRHYSFLKAAAALWQVLVDSQIRATFKIDLDQVFPQEKLVSETGRSAFEHLSDPLWGSYGKDHEGKDIMLGMMAGALVNESDAQGGLFTPDVKWPQGEPDPDQWVFASPWPQALSTEAEMMARYGKDGHDGITSCLQRVHVTGGTTGILVDQLRKYRPFTPGWVGRAEDQAYLLSTLFSVEGPALRYVHGSGLIMRHDKEAFASQAMEAARIGKMVGDYVRILTFTAFARALPWSVEEIKDATDPFTGCFISRLPVTVSCLRMALKVAKMFASGSADEKKDGVDLVRIGSARLAEALKELADADSVRARLDREREGWDLYYDLLDELERGLEKGEEFAEAMRARARELVEGWRI